MSPHAESRSAGRHAPVSIRVIARMDVKMEHLIKGVQMEGWRKLGDPNARAVTYYQQGIDEIVYMDVVASLYERNNLSDIVRHVASDVFVPITVGGGVRNLEAAKSLLDVGADKVAINTAATQRPELLREISDTYGSQATVLSIEAKRQPGGGWEAMTDNGRNHTGLDPIAWAVKGQELGAGELLITSIDQDGTKRGFDVELIREITSRVDIPVIASGGAGTPDHVADAVCAGGASAVAVAKILHTDETTVADIKSALLGAGLQTREIA